MLRTAKLIPNDNARDRYFVRGVVEGHGVREAGWWIFRKRTPVICVRINENQLAMFNKIVRESMRTPDGPLEAIKSVIQIGMTEVEMNGYAVGSEIGITFGYAHEADQLFTGAVPLKVMKLELIKDLGG